MQAARPYVIYQNVKINSRFEDFFKRFWENSKLNPAHPSQSQIGEYEGHPDEKEAIEEFEKKRYNSRQDPKNHNFKPIEDFYNKSPMLSSAEELLQACKEGLIEELVLISCYRKSKNQDEEVYKRVLSGVTAINKSAEETVKEKVAKIKKTFGKFPQTKIEMTGMIRPDQGDTKSPTFKPYRWEVLRDKFPNFDIFIDDNPNIIKECLENLPKDKIYAINDYACNRKKSISNERTFFFTTSVSMNLKNEHFTCLDTKQSNDLLTQSSTNFTKENIWKKPHIYLAFIAGLVLAGIIFGIYHLIRKKAKKNPN